MRRLFGSACVLALAVATPGCQGAEPDRPGSPAARPSGSPLAPARQPKQVTLPDDAAALAAVLDRQTRSVQTVRVAVTVGTGGAASVAMTGSLRRSSGQPPAASLKIVQTGGEEPGTTHTVVVGGAVFTKQDGQEYAPGKSWLRITRQDLADPGLGDTKQTFEAVLNEAEQAVRQVSADAGLTTLAHGAVTRPPTWEKLDSTPVRRYTGTSDTAALAGETGDPRFRQLASHGVRRLPWTIWVDRHGLPRQFASTVTIPDAGTITTKAAYSGWGEPVAIAPPPSAQVATIGD